MQWNPVPRYWLFVKGIHRLPAQKARSFGVYFDDSLNKQLSLEYNDVWKA